MIYYFTGQPHSGKTTLANLLRKKILKSNLKKEVFIIDGDNLRAVTNNSDYSLTGRIQNIKTAHNIALFLNSNKEYDVIIAMVSPYEGLRTTLKLSGEVIEIFTHTTDIRGREHFHVKDYQKPTINYIDIDTTNIGEKESLKELIYKINANQYPNGSL